MSKRFLSLAASVALAAIGTFVLLSYVRGAEERAVAGEQTVEVLVVDAPISRGTPAEKISSNVQTALVPAKVQAVGSVASLDGLEGTVAAVDLLPGEQLISSRFVEPEALVIQSAVEVPEGLLEVTVALSPERAVGGQPLPGDLVAVIASFDPFQSGTAEPGADEPGAEQPAETTQARTPSSSHVLLHKVLVTNMQVEQTVSPAVLTEEDSTPGFDPAPRGQLLVTLAVSAADAERVVFAAEHGRIWLAREPIDAPEAGTSIQTRETIYR